MAQLEIIGMERTFSPSPGRQGKLDRVVTYRREDQTLGMVLVPDETFSVQGAQAAVAQAEAERRLATPIKFTAP